MMLNGCIDDEPKLSDIALFVSPDADTEVELASGEKAKYDLRISTIHQNVASLQITSFDRYNGEVVWVDRTMTQKQEEYQFVYTAPEIPSESTDVELTFTATDNDGHKVAIKRNVLVINKMVSLPEKSGIVLYAEGAGLPDALNLDDVARPFCLANSPSPEEADIYMTAGESFSNITWASNTKLKFLRNNTFNYAEATAQSINAVYGSSTREDILTDIKVNDIIIIGHGQSASGVFMITNVVRGQGAADCIQFSYKGIGHEQVSPLPDEE